MCQTFILSAYGGGGGGDGDNKHIGRPHWAWGAKMLVSAKRNLIILIAKDTFNMPNKCYSNFSSDLNYFTE